MLSLLFTKNTFYSSNLTEQAKKVIDKYSQVITQHEGLHIEFSVKNMLELVEYFLTIMELDDKNFKYIEQGILKQFEFLSELQSHQLSNLFELIKRFYEYNRLIINLFDYSPSEIPIGIKKFIQEKNNSLAQTVQKIFNAVLDETQADLRIKEQVVVRIINFLRNFNSFDYTWFVEETEFRKFNTKDQYLFRYNDKFYHLEKVPDNPEIQHFGLEVIQKLISLVPREDNKQVIIDEKESAENHLNARGEKSYQPLVYIIELF